MQTISKTDQHSVALPFHFKSPSQLGRNQTSTTKNDTTQHSQLEVFEQNQEDPSPKSQKVKQLQAEINRVKMAQEELKTKFEKVLQHLTLQVSKKDETNIQLERQIHFLQNCLRQSKEDLGIIKNYLKKQEQRESCKQNSRRSANPNETIYKANRFTAINHIFIDITMQSMMTSRKSKSSRMKLLKKQIKG